MIRKNRRNRNMQWMMNNGGYNYNMQNMKSDMKLKPGDSSEDVRLLQEILVDITEIYPTIPEITVDGIYGEKTRAAVKRFQELMGIYDTGIVDNITWNKLLLIYSKKKAMNDNIREAKEEDGLDLSSNVIKLGSKGRYVIELQEYINKVANLYPAIPKLSIDGVFGDKTHDAVVKFQTLFNLEPDGIVGNITWNTLYNASLGKLTPGNFIDMTDDFN